MENTAARLQELVRLIADVEVRGKKVLLGRVSDTVSLKAGTLVHNPTYGVTMLAMDGAPGAYYLVNLSHSDDRPKKFGSLVAPVLLNGKPFTLFQRTAEMEAA
jgi:hypothetical protein